MSVMDDHDDTFQWESVRNRLKHPASWTSSQCCYTLHVGGGCGWRALDRRHRVIGHLCVASATTNQEEEDLAPPAAGERGG